MGQNIEWRIAVSGRLWLVLTTLLLIASLRATAAAGQLELRISVPRVTIKKAGRIEVPYEVRNRGKKAIWTPKDVSGALWYVYDGADFAPRTIDVLITPLEPDYRREQLVKVVPGQSLTGFVTIEVKASTAGTIKVANQLATYTLQRGRDYTMDVWIFAPERKSYPRALRLAPFSRFMTEALSSQRVVVRAR